MKIESFYIFCRGTTCRAQLIPLYYISDSLLNVRSCKRYLKLLSAIIATPILTIQSKSRKIVSIYNA
jgi:hypothetical protein